ncbi:hypothetical protein BS17DRAFT_163789 [Gyrodon lividus]|nr:hypothetical protein BS17DRAFT_163789 [Gyrodon lividus]
MGLGGMSGDAGLSSSSALRTCNGVLGGDGGDNGERGLELKLTGGGGMGRVIRGGGISSSSAVFPLISSPLAAANPVLLAITLSVSVCTSTVFPSMCSLAPISLYLDVAVPGCSISSRNSVSV